MTTAPAMQTQDWKRSLLLTNRSAMMELDPFPYFCVDNYLPADLFEEARRQFPTTTARDQYGNLKQVFSPHRRTEDVKKFLAENKAWRDFISFFDPDEFIQGLRTFPGSALRRLAGFPGSAGGADERAR